MDGGESIELLPWRYNLRMCVCLHECFSYNAVLIYRLFHPQALLQGLPGSRKVVFFIYFVFLDLILSQLIRFLSLGSFIITRVMCSFVWDFFMHIFSRVFVDRCGNYICEIRSKFAVLDIVEFINGKMVCFSSVF